MGAKKFAKAFAMLKSKVEESLDLYRVSRSTSDPSIHVANTRSLQPELKKFLWPIFLYAYLELVESKYPDDAKAFLDKFKIGFEAAHADELKVLETITLPAHAQENHMAKLYKTNKYRIPVGEKSYDILISQLEKEFDNGGHTILRLMASYCQIKTVESSLVNPFAFMSIFENHKGIHVNPADLEEGVPGAFTGVRTDATPTATLKLGPLPMDPEFQGDVREELIREDQRNPPNDGKLSLVEELEHKIKREESADGPSRTDVPLPPPRQRDVLNEVERIREYRDRFRIEGRTGGVGPAVSVCMFTFHNTLGA